MTHITRRNFGKAALSLALSMAGPTFVMASSTEKPDSIPPDLEKKSPDEWMGEWKKYSKLNKDLQGPLDLRRFLDPTYVLLNDIGWKPNTGCCSEAVVMPGSVTVPKGFVTDFASVPRVFWSLFRPDGKYAYAAVVHDFLYWQQDRDKAEADSIFRSIMNETKITDASAYLLYKAVDLFGDAAWDENARLKKQGERRVLRVLPDSSDIEWVEWKK